MPLKDRQQATQRGDYGSAERAVHRQMKGSVRYVAFDFDGVLVESNHIKEGAYRKIFPSDAETQRCVSKGTRMEGDRYAKISAILSCLESRQLPLPACSPEDSLVLCAERYNEECESSTVACREVRGAIELLDTLQRSDIPMFISSATPTDVLRRIVGARGWEPRFQGVFGSHTPKTEALQTILTATGAKPEMLVMVGDHESDRRAASRVGCRFVGIINPFSDFDPLPKPSLPDLVGLAPLLGLLPTDSL